MAKERKFREKPNLTTDAKTVLSDITSQLENMTAVLHSQMKNIRSGKEDLQNKMNEIFTRRPLKLVLPDIKEESWSKRRKRFESSEKKDICCMKSGAKEPVKEEVCCRSHSAGVDKKSKKNLALARSKLKNDLSGSSRKSRIGMSRTSTSKEKKAQCPCNASKYGVSADLNRHLVRQDSSEQMDTMLDILSGPRNFASGARSETTTVSSHSSKKSVSFSVSAITSAKCNLSCNFPDCKKVSSSQVGAARSRSQTSDDDDFANYDAAEIEQLYENEYRARNDSSSSSRGSIEVTTESKLKASKIIDTFIEDVKRDFAKRNKKIPKPFCSFDPRCIGPSFKKEAEGCVCDNDETVTESVPKIKAIGCEGETKFIIRRKSCGCEVEPTEKAGQKTCPIGTPMVRKKEEDSMLLKKEEGSISRKKKKGSMSVLSVPSGKSKVDDSSVSNESFISHVTSSENVISEEEEEEEEQRRESEKSNSYKTPEEILSMFKSDDESSTPCGCPAGNHNPSYKQKKRMKYRKETLEFVDSVLQKLSTIPREFLTPKASIEEPDTLDGERKTPPKPDIELLKQLISKPADSRESSPCPPCCSEYVKGLIGTAETVHCGRFECVADPNSRKGSEQ